MITVIQCDTALDVGYCWIVWGTLILEKAMWVCTSFMAKNGRRHESNPTCEAPKNQETEDSARMGTVEQVRTVRNRYYPLVN